MRISKTLLNAIQKLLAGESVAASNLRSDIAETLIAEGHLTVRAKGSRRLFSAIDTSALHRFLISKYEEFKYISSTQSINDDFATSRFGQAAATGNSKLMRVNSCPGFPINSYEAIQCQLNGLNIEINPPEGSFIFIHDWQAFKIPSNIVIIGTENMENFRLIRKQKSFFERYLKERYHATDKKILFVSRYPQSSSLYQWLQSIPNDYIHFGDFDLAGINIYLSQFHKYIGSRASFLIPSDIEHRIINGSSKRYNDQIAKYKNLSTTIPELQNLINLINKHHRCYDQEGYI